MHMDLIYLEHFFLIKKYKKLLQNLEIFIVWNNTVIKEYYYIEKKVGNFLSKKECQIEAYKYAKYKRIYMKWE